VIAPSYTGVGYPVDVRINQTSARLIPCRDPGKFNFSITQGTVIGFFLGKSVAQCKEASTAEAQSLMPGSSSLFLANLRLRFTTFTQNNTGTGKARESSCSGDFDAKNSFFYNK
jgi:hypothetical protein